MARPAEIVHGTRAGRGAERLPHRRTRQALERIRKRVRIGRIVEQAFLPVAHDLARRSMRGATTGRPDAMYSKIFSGDQ